MTNLGQSILGHLGFGPASFGQSIVGQSISGSGVCHGPTRWGPNLQKIGPRRGPRRVGAQNFTLFFPLSLLPCSLFFSLSGCLLVDFLWCFRRPALTCARLEFSGCRVKPWRLRDRRTLGIFFYRLWPIRLWSNRLWPKNFDRVWPTLIDRLWPTFGWPTLAKIGVSVSWPNHKQDFLRSKKNKQGAPKGGP